MDISQQQFEESIKLHTEPAELENKLKKANSGLNYADMDVDLMWIGWQASRENLEVKLPGSNNYSCDDYFHDGYDKAICDYENELTRNAVKINKSK